MLPDRSLLIGQQIEKFKCDIFVDFKTLCFRIWGRFFYKKYSQVVILNFGSLYRLAAGEKELSVPH